MRPNLSSGVEQLAFSPVPEADAILGALERIGQHGREYNTEECRGKDVTLLDAVSYRKGFLFVTIVEYFDHAIVELSHHCNESAGSAELLHDVP